VTAIEYALLAAIMAVAVIGSIRFVADENNSMYTKVRNAIVEVHGNATN
jgi:Flp pilus assembly pilin Flp